MGHFSNVIGRPSAVLIAAESAFVGVPSTATFRCNHANVSGRR